MLHLGGMHVQSALFFETPEQMCLRIFRQLKPRTTPPAIEILFRPFANASSFIRLENDRLELRISDALEGAPAPILEALLFVLVAKLYRKPVAGAYRERYRRYMSRKDMRRSLHLLRQIRGRKFVSGPRGEHYHLDEIFDRLNDRYFHGLLAKPLLGWSRVPSRTTLGHFDPSHNAVILSRILDRAGVAPLAVEYVVFHEMLHLRYPVEHQGLIRRVHTREFRQAEKQFDGLKEARQLLKHLS